jgi:O-antigen/teichoic acid export membrane protein
MLFLAPISSLYDGIFRGLKRFRELAIISLSVGFVSVIFVYLLVKNYGLIGALISQSLFYLVLVLSLFFVYGNLHFQFDKQLMRSIFNYSLLVGLANLGYFLYTKVDLIMLGYFDYTVETGYYGLINNIFALSIILFSILGAVIAPDNINLQVNKKIELLKKKIKNYIIYSSIIGFLISIVLFILVPLLIKLFLPLYDSHSFFIIFYVFLFIIPISVLEATIATGFITPLGYVKILTKTVFIGGVMNCILNYIFLFYFGYLGIIISTVIVHNAVNIIKIFIFYRQFNL